MIKLKDILSESSPGFENRQVGDALPTLDSVRTAYQAKKSLEEAESFSAINKDSGEVSVFKSKDARDSAIKSGTHDKKDDKDSKGADSKKDTPKVNIFNKDKKEPKKKIPNKSTMPAGWDGNYKGNPTKKIPDNDYSYQDEPKKAKSSEPSKFDIEDVQDFTDVGDIIKNNSNISKQQISKLKQLSADWEDAEGDMQAGGSDDDYQEKVSDIRADVEDILSSKDDETEKAPRDEKNALIVPKELGLKDGAYNDDWYRETFAWVDTKEQQKVVNDLIKKSSPQNVDKMANRGKHFQDQIQKVLDKRGGSYNAARPGNPQVNKVVSGKAKKLGITPQKLGKEEYEKRMSQAAVEALTDANFHSESRALIAVLEDNPELAKNPSDDPNKPKDMFSDEYDEWKKGTAWASSFGDSSDGTDDIAHSATGESSWDGQESIDAIAHDLKMNGSHKLAAKIQSIFDEKNESTTSISDMIPESVQINEGTRSQVGVIGRNGKIISAYVHYDGYPSNMKPGLKKHMKSDKDVLKLIKMGGARGIFDDKEIEYYKSGQPQKGDSKDVAGYIKAADSKNGAEFVYLYNMKDKKWYYADTYKDTKLKKLF